MNKVILEGTVARDLDIRTFSSTTKVGFQLMVVEKFKNAAGEDKEIKNWFDCEAWGKIAEELGESLSDGKKVKVEGKLKMDSWQDKVTGQNRKKVIINVQKYNLGESTGEEPTQTADEPAKKSKPTPKPTVKLDDDIPF